MDKKMFLKELMEGRAYDYVANHYFEMTTWELKEILLATMGIGLDEYNDDDRFHKSLLEELENRDFFDE